MASHISDHYATYSSYLFPRFGLGDIIGYIGCMGFYLVLALRWIVVRWGQMQWLDNQSAWWITKNNGQ